MEITASALARKWGRTRARVHQLVRQGRIQPAPQKRMIGDRTWVYFFDPKCKVLPPSRPPWRPKRTKAVDNVK